LAAEKKNFFNPVLHEQSLRNKRRMSKSLLNPQKEKFISMPLLVFCVQV